MPFISHPTTGTSIHASAPLRRMVRHRTDFPACRAWTPLLFTVSAKVPPRTVTRPNRSVTQCGGMPQACYWRVCIFQDVSVVDQLPTVASQSTRWVITLPGDLAGTSRLPLERVYSI